MVNQKYTMIVNFQFFSCVCPLSQSFLLRDVLPREVPLYFLWDGTTTDSGCPLATILKLIESNNFMIATFSNSQATHKIISYAEFMKLNTLLDVNSYTVILDTLIHNMSLLAY